MGSDADDRLSYRARSVVNAQFGLSLLEVAADGFLSSSRSAATSFIGRPIES